MNQSEQVNDRPIYTYWNATNEHKSKLSDISCFYVQQTDRFCSIMRSTFGWMCLKNVLCCVKKIVFGETRYRQPKILSICTVERFVAIETLHFHLKIILVYRYFRVSKSCRKTKTKYNQQKQHPENVVVYGLRCIVIVTVAVVRHQN